jgi:hypothetical protein
MVRAGSTTSGSAVTLQSCLSKAFIYVAMSRLMARRLGHT